MGASHRSLGRIDQFLEPAGTTLTFILEYRHNYLFLSDSDMSAPTTTPAELARYGLHIICHVDPSAVYNIDRPNPSPPPTRENPTSRPIFFDRVGTVSSVIPLQPSLSSGFPRPRPPTLLSRRRASSGRSSTVAPVSLSSGRSRCRPRNGTA